MLTTLRALGAMISRNLRIALRRPELLVQTMAVPVVVLSLASVIFGASDSWPIAVVDKSQSAASAQLARTIDDTRGPTGDYFRVVESDAEAASAQLAAGRLQLAITIPPDFEQSGTVEIATYNINSDAMKNVRLRVTTAANLYDGAADPDQVSAIIERVAPTDVQRTAFMGGSAVILALLLGAAMIAANLYAVDSEHRTQKEIALTPVGSYLAGLGAAAAGWILAFVAAVPTVLVALAFGTRAGFAEILQAAVIVAPAMAAAAGAGVVAAVLLRTHRIIQPTLILLALGSYFASGGFIPVSALPPLARGINTWWPPSYVFEWANPLLHGFESHAAPAMIGAVGLFAVVAAALAALSAQWASTRNVAHGQ
ncbi:ABC transporter permease [Zhihengliuella halotolerans]|uniref:ABC-2 family transporter n=1 Tax=Zhihengliuella halotolerans TaxID=370736 RepID=A0A4Q8AF60_9MICC|nr:ABC transporter permease [Zhihengliuella halotolerans]RZU62844.1 ABC-2 family transporter [Zhihengliuella halotolerans]